MSKLTRALTVGVTLAAITFTGTTIAARADVNQTPAQAPAPVPGQPNRQRGWLLASFGVPATALVLVGGLAVFAPDGHAAELRPRPPTRPDNDPCSGRHAVGGPTQTP